MKIEQLKAFLSTLGVHNVSYTGGLWAQASCPLSPFTHHGGHDNNPSFGVTVGEDTSHFNCYVCSKGSLEELVQTLELYCKNQPQLAYRYNLLNARSILTQEATGVINLPEYAELTPSPYGEFQEWPEWWLDEYALYNDFTPSLNYVVSRGVWATAAKYFELHVDLEKHRVICPFRTASGRLAGARGRSFDEGCPKHLRHYDYQWNMNRNTAVTWHNESAFNLPGPMLIVEGQFDAMRIWPFHQKVMAILSAKTTPYKMRKLTACDSVVLMLDNDKTGQEKTQEWLRYLVKKGVHTGTIDIPEGRKDPGDCSDEELKIALTGL